MCYLGKTTGIVLLSATLVGCASQPSSIQATYIPPAQFQDYDCDQIREEMGRVSRRANELHGTLDEKADTDAAQVGLGFLFWPALFLLEGGDGPEAQEYARLKGEKEALEKASVEKKCGLNFKQYEVKSAPEPKADG